MYLFGSHTESNRITELPFLVRRTGHLTHPPTNNNYKLWSKSIHNTLKIYIYLKVLENIQKQADSRWKVILERRKSYEMNLLILWLSLKTSCHQYPDRWLKLIENPQSFWSEGSGDRICGNHSHWRVRGNPAKERSRGKKFQLSCVNSAKLSAWSLITHT